MQILYLLVRKGHHNPNANSLYSDLEDFSKDVKSLAFAYDVLISKGLQHITASNLIPVTLDTINFRFLIKDGAVWKEFNATSSRASRSDRNYNRLLSKIRTRANTRNEVLVIKKDLREIDKWLIPY